MIDPCECGDVERCTLCRFRQTYMSAADAWQAGLAMAKECESLQSQLTQARAELVRERTLHADLRGIYGDLLKGHRYRDHRAIEDLIPRFEAYCKTFNEVSTREELIDE